MCVYRIKKLLYRYTIRCNWQIRCKPDQVFFNILPEVLKVELKLKYYLTNSPYTICFKNLFSDFKKHKIMWFDGKTKFYKRLILEEVNFNRS